jgi:hypothetical protein
LHPVAGGHPKIGDCSCSQILGSNSDRLPNVYIYALYRIIHYNFDEYLRMFLTKKGVLYGTRSIAFNEI